MNLYINGGSSSLADNPCIGKCSTTWGDIICKGCGRSETQIRDWCKFSQIEKKIIVMDCWNAGYTPKQKKEALLEKLDGKKSHIDISVKRKLVV
jgi:predicted Fe-S protein YdhL (DUF1289 family)